MILVYKGGQYEGGKAPVVFEVCGAPAASYLLLVPLGASSCEMALWGSWAAARVVASSCEMAAPLASARLLVFLFFGPIYLSSVCLPFPQPMSCARRAAWGFVPRPLHHGPVPCLSHRVYMGSR